MENGICEHLTEVTKIKSAGLYVCEQCIKNGGSWLHLRTCQACGITLCCNSSPNQHAAKHYHESSHPVVVSAEPGERWLWCYRDEIMVEY